MKTTSTILICSSLAAVTAAVTAAAGQRFRFHPQDQKKQQPRLMGAVQTAPSDEFYNLGSHYSTVETDNYVASSDDEIRYNCIYQLRMDLSSPLSLDMNGKPQIDNCIGWEWESFVSPTNFTWYGFNFQLPEDATGINGGYNTALVQPLKEDGFVLSFNETYKDVVNYNFTTSTDRPVIRARINNGLFWNTFVFDFTNRSNYVIEHQSLQYVVKCMTEESHNETGTSRTYTYTTVVMPTLTFSLELLSWYDGRRRTSSMVGSLIAITALVSTAFFLLVYVIETIIGNSKVFMEVRKQRPRKSL
jgi:hypothetical protein